MLVVTAVADMTGDYESYKQIAEIAADGVTLSYKSEHPKPAAGGSEPTSAPSETNTHRKILTADLSSAHDYAELFGDTDPPSFPGTTAISASRDVLAELKEKGTTQFSFRPDGLKGAVSSLVSTLGGIAGIDPKSIGDGSLATAGKEECALQRTGDGSVAFPVLLNGEATKLPALHARCATDDGPADFYILDQLDYPLMLSWKLGQGSQLQVIKITYPAEKKDPAPKMEQDLEEKKKVEIYGIYFDFASDRLKPESTPVLDEIAQVMEKHPDWKLSVSGHTDNIGGDAYNLDLSKRRAAAVKQALVTRYHVAPDRLSTEGYGASRPVDTNDTLEGRARNRRVELMRE
jgi:outer membrane protein OmpA-like peptidoglycan-associated protein